MTKRKIAEFGVVAGVVAALLLVGSVIYWIGEGRPGSADAFRERVEANGLLVEWENNGPTGGSGFVETNCGLARVDVSEFDDVLTVSWDLGSDKLTPEVVRRIVSCSVSPGYDYFGSAQLAQGSTLTTTVQGVTSAADVRLLQSPDGVKVTLSDRSDDSVQLTIEVDADAPLGAAQVVFDVAGESEPVEWTLDVLEP